MWTLQLKAKWTIGLIAKQDAAGLNEDFCMLVPLFAEDKRIGRLPLKTEPCGLQASFTDFLPMLHWPNFLEPRARGDATDSSEDGDGNLEIILD